MFSDPKEDPRNEVNIRVHPMLEDELTKIKRILEERMRSKGMIRPIFRNEASYVAAQILTRRLKDLKIELFIENNRKRGRIRTRP